MTVKTWACIAALSLSLGACAVTGEGPMSVETLYSSGQCGGPVDGVTVTLIEGQRQRDDFRVRIASDGMEPATPAFDFGAGMAVLIEMGAKPSGGYGLRLMEPIAHLLDGELEVRVEWIEPPPGMMLTQAITSPCLLLEVAAADYRRIVVRDQEGKVRSVWNRE